MEYEKSRRIDAPADAVWAFVSKVENLPRWLVETREADQPGPDQVHLERVTEGRPYELEGLFSASADQRRVEWGSKGTGDYAGWLQVYEGDEFHSEVNVHLSFLADQPEAHAGRVGQEVNAELDASLDRLARCFSGES